MHIKRGFINETPFLAPPQGLECRILAGFAGDLRINPAFVPKSGPL